MAEVGVDGLRRLTDGERRQYERQGFLIVPDVFRAEDLDALDRQLDALISGGGGASGPRAGWLFQASSRSELVAGFAADPRILALLEGVVHPGIAIHSTKLVTKRPRSDIECHWHQDEAFYTDRDDPATVSRTRMSVWVPFQDSDERNGCLHVVPESHRWGLKEYEIQSHGTCVRKLKTDFDFSTAVPIPVRAGSVVLFNAYLWHHSKGNSTDRARRAFIISYQEATVSKVVGSYGREWKIVRAPSSGNPGSRPPLRRDRR